MLKTKNFHVIFKEAQDDGSTDSLRKLVARLEALGECTYNIIGTKGYGGYPVEITYGNGSHIFGGLIDHGKNWQIHT